MPTTKNEDDVDPQAEQPEIDPRAESAPPEGEPVEPYVDPYKQILNPLELPANPVAAANYQGDNVDPAAPISPDRAEQAMAAIQAEQDKMQAVIDSVPAHPATGTPDQGPDQGPAA